MSAKIGIGNEANRLIIEGQKLVAGKPTNMKVSDWISIYTEIGSELDGAQAKRVSDLAFQIVQISEARKRQAKDASS